MYWAGRAEGTGVTQESTNRAIDAAVELRGETLLRALRQPSHKQLSWGAVRSIFIGAITFGIWPLLAWQGRFVEMVGWQNAQWKSIGLWLRGRSGAPAAERLGEESPLGSRPLLGFLSLGVMAAVVLQFMLTLGHFNFGGLEGLKEPLLDSTYRFPANSHHGLPSLYAPRLFMDWSAGLSLAYALHWLRVKLYSWDLRRQVRRINNVLEDEGVAPMALPETGIGLRPMWVVGAVIFAVFGVIWGVPMMLAGGLQRDCERRVGPELRAELAERIRMLMAGRREPATPASRAQAWQTCPRPGCRKVLAAQAAFCSRCGTRLVGHVHLVA